MKPQTIELNGAALKAEAEKSHEFLTLTYYGANRDRNREVTDVEQMRKGIEMKHDEKLDPERWLAAFKKLEDMGMGALIMGRRGNPTRFRWNYSLKAIGMAAMNGSSITAHRIVPKMRGDKVVNDYNSTRSSFVERPAKHESADTQDEAPARAPMRVAPDTKRVAEASAPAASSTNIIYIALRPDFVFEADMPNLTAREADVLCAAIKRCVK